MSFVVSAPGKTILYGEHSVVHNQPAIAAALGLRAYMHVEKNIENENEIVLILGDMGLTARWNIKDLPFRNKGGHTELDTELIQELEKLLEKEQETFQHAGALAFLYMYCNMCDSNTPGMIYTVRSMVPIGAGLGSSASYSVCCATVLMKATHHEEQINAENINNWAFLGEKCIHGNPSGIDNAVATRGGAVYFQKEPKLLQSIQNFPAINLVLVNTKVPRRTKELVAGVGELKDRLSGIMEPILNSMGKLVIQAKHYISNSVVDSDQLANKLAELARINHGLLVSIGVSHSSLEKVKSKSDLLKIGETKLTGAGGGGCAITIVTTHDHEKVEEFKRELENTEEYKCYETTLGAKGVGYVEELQINRDEFEKFSGEELDKIGNWVYYY